jgi:hypothetical protein
VCQHCLAGVCSYYMPHVVGVFLKWHHCEPSVSDSTIWPVGHCLRRLRTQCLRISTFPIEPHVWKTIQSSELGPKMANAMEAWPETRSLVLIIGLLLLKLKEKRMYYCTIIAINTRSHTRGPWENPRGRTAHGCALITVLSKAVNIVSKRKSLP